MLRTIGGRTSQAPDLYGVVGWILGSRGVEGVRKDEFHAILVGMKSYRKVRRLAGVADAVEPAVLMLVRCPTKHATGIEVAVLWMEPSTHDTCRKIRER